MSIIARRLHRQRVSWQRFDKPTAVVGWLGAVQAQDYPGAKWGIGLRVREPNDDVVERAFNEGRILRTHVMRPTWHFVTPQDVRWLLQLTASRVHSANAHMYRRVGLDKSLSLRSERVIAKALEGGKNLTRAELGNVLESKSVVAKGLRLIYIMMHAELDCVVCSGPRRGKQFTYALFDERAPKAKSLSREKALRALTLRYFAGHGPATIRDFAWWSGLTVSDAKAGLEATRSDLAQEVVDGETYWSLDREDEPDASSEAYLLPTFDEMLVGYSSFDVSRRGEEGKRNKLVFSSPLILGGRIVGTWKRASKKGTVLVEVAPFRPLEPSASEKIDAAVERYGIFLGMDTKWRTV